MRATAPEDDHLKLIGHWWPHSGGLLCIASIWKGENSQVMLALSLGGNSFCVVKVIEPHSSVGFADEHKTVLLVSEWDSDVGILSKWVHNSHRGAHVCVQQSVLGPSTQDILERWDLTWPLVREWIVDVGNSLINLHNSGHVHMDVRPENIVVRKPMDELKATIDCVEKAILKTPFQCAHQGNRSRVAKKYYRNVIAPALAHRSVETECDLANVGVALIDYGNSEKLCDLALNKEAVAHHYVSPEMIEQGEVGTFTDWWCLGITVAEWLGELLYSTEDQSAHLCEIVARGSAGWRGWVHEHVHRLEACEVDEIESTLETLMGLDYRHRSDGCRNLVSRLATSSRLYHARCLER